MTLYFKQVVGLNQTFSHKVTSLYSGVVKNVHVLEGEKIAKGDIIATLIDEDARLIYSR